MRTEEWQEKAAFIDKLRELTDRLNRCRAAYEAHAPLVNDEVYDILLSDLQTLEKLPHKERQSSDMRKPSTCSILRVGWRFLFGRKDTTFSF